MAKKLIPAALIITLLTCISIFYYLKRAEPRSIHHAIGFTSSKDSFSYQYHCHPETKYHAQTGIIVVGKKAPRITVSSADPDIWKIGTLKINTETTENGIYAITRDGEIHKTSFSTNTNEAKKFPRISDELRTELEAYSWDKY